MKPTPVPARLMLVVKPMHRFAFAIILSVAAAAAADRPRVFITESHALNLVADAAAGGAKNTVSLSGGNSPQSLDVIKSFAQLCPQVIVTGDPEKADYVVRLDHEALSPITPFTRGNKVAVFDKSSDLLYTSSARILGTAVKGACSAITGHPHQ